MSKNVTTLSVRLILGAFCLYGIFLTSCSYNENINTANQVPLPHAFLANPPAGALMLSANTGAGDAIGNMMLPRVGSASSILVASMVDMENFDKSSPFGRLTMQQVGSRLSQHGYKVIEARLGSELRMSKNNGEFMLTRESMRLLSKNYNAHAVLVGTYTESADRIFISLRAVRFYDNAIIGAYEYYLPKNDDVLALIGKSQIPDSRVVWRQHSARTQSFKKGK